MRGVWMYTGLAVTLGMVSAPGVVRADDDAKTVEATGQAAIVNGDVGGARDRARKDALRNAVEQVAGANVTAVTTVKDYELISDAVSAQTDGLVSSYKILKEENKDGAVKITVSAVVSKAKAMDAFSLALLEAGRPKVAFVIAERMAGQTDFSVANGERGKTENMLIDYFQQRGLTVVELGGLTGINLNGAASSGELSAADAARIAEQADAQYVVIGKVVGVDAGPVMVQGLRSYNMSMTLKMFSTSTHIIVATTTKSNAIPCVSPNLAPLSCYSLYRNRVVDKGAQDLLEKTSKAFIRDSVTGSKHVQVLVAVSSFGTLRNFIKGLDDIRGVNKVQQRSFKSGRAVLDIELEGGDVNYLATELSSKKVGGSSVEVVGVNTDKLEIELKK